MRPARPIRGLTLSGVDEWQVGDAVRDDLHVRRVGAVGAGQQRRCRGCDITTVAAAT